MIKTPVATARCKTLAGKKLAIVPILRAGLGMVDGVLQLIPAAKRRSHRPVPRPGDPASRWNTTARCPPDIAERDVIVVDPMLATGGSASAAIRLHEGTTAARTSS